MQIIIAKSIETARDLVAQGYCPVECRWGDQVLLDYLQLDHHGDMADLESVAIRAYRDHFGARAADPRFVINHVDRDNTLAIAALSGLLPHTSRQVPAHLAKSLQRDITPLVELCARLDANPVGIDRVAELFGDYDILWGVIISGPPSVLQAYAGVQLWQRLTEGFAPVQLLKATKAEEQDRIEKAEAAENITFPNNVMFIESPVYGFDRWYGLKAETNAADPANWEFPVVVAYVASKKGISIGCPNPEVAKALFGPQGIIPVLQAILGPNAGGHPAFGGGERDRVYTREEAIEAARKISEMLSK